MDEVKHELPIGRAAELLNTTQLNILMHIKHGNLSGLEKEGQWYLSQKSFDDFLAQDQQPETNVTNSTQHCGHGCGSCG